MSKEKLAVVIPAKNGRETIGKVIEKVRNEVKKSGILSLFIFQFKL